MIYFTLDEILDLIAEVENEINTPRKGTHAPNKYKLWSKITINNFKKKLINRAKEKHKKQ